MVRGLIFIIFFTLFLILSTVLVLGASPVFERVRDLLQIEPVDLSIFAAPVVDGTIRFLGVIALAFSAFGVWVAINYRNLHRFVPIMLLVLILGGSARIWSVYSTSDVAFLSYVLSIFEIIPALVALLLYVMGGRPKDY